MEISFEFIEIDQAVAIGVPTDSQVSAYADDYYQYDSGQRVTEAIVQNEGCSSCSGGQGTYQFSYAASSNSNGLNNWATKTTETLPDGNSNIIYANYAGETSGGGV